MREIWMMQPRFERRTGSTPFTLVEQPRFRAGFDFLRLRADAGEIDAELADWWEEFCWPSDARARDCSSRCARAAQAAARRARRGAGGERGAAKRGAGRAPRHGERRRARRRRGGARAGRAAKRRRGAAPAGDGGTPSRAAEADDGSRSTREPVRAYVGLGANLGDRARRAARRAARAGARCRRRALQRRSSLYRTAPIDAGGPDYINAVAELRHRARAAGPAGAAAAPSSAVHGRERPYRNAPRTLDLDLLLYGEARIDERRR